MLRSSAVLSPILCFAVACADAFGPEPVDVDALLRLPPGFTLGGRGLAAPDMPALLTDTHLMEADDEGLMQFDRPLLPALRTTADARVGVNIRTRDGNFEIYVLGPEGVTEPLGRSGPGVQMIKDTRVIDPHDLFKKVADEEENHVVICDTTSQFPAPGEPTNPYPCAVDPAQDCYDITLIVDVQAACNIDGCLEPGEVFDTKLWGTTATVAVSDPKTELAKIASIDLGKPISGPSFPIRGFFEPSVSGDGRLLVARLDWTRIEVPKGDDPKVTELRPTNMAYVLSDDVAAFEPCDVAQWSHVEPISHLPFDPGAVGYGLAANVFRDGEGNVVEDYETVGLSYPWLGRDAANLFFTSGRATNYYDADPNVAVNVMRVRYPWKCLDGVECGEPTTELEIDKFEDITVTRGIGVMGLWTRGKMVVLDSPLNHTDFGMGRDLDEHRMLKLYSPGTGPDPSATGEIHVGTGRDNLGVAPLGTTQNTAFIDSFEQRFFFSAAMLPTTVREVVWTVNTGHGSAEVAFDDFLDTGAFIVAEMIASISQTTQSGRDSLLTSDGFVRVPFDGLAGFQAPVRFQNAATVFASEWQIPPAGIAFGGVRVEPVGLGGINGKGAWLSGRRDGIVFSIPEQTTYDVSAYDWYTGLFIDQRSDDDGITRSLLGWPDGSSIALEGLSTIVVEDSTGARVATVQLPDAAPYAWRHLGFSLTDGGTTLEVLLDGFQWEVVALPAPLLLPVEGPLVLGDRPGDAHPGYRGWVDELKVLTYVPSPEIACEHARGTLLELGPTADETWQLVADERPAAAHDVIANALGAPLGSRYVCFHDYTQAVAVASNVTPLPADTTSVRHALLRPQGNLVAGLPRPDESETPFCVSCHAEGQPGGLSLEALAFDRTVLLDDDRRRQPSQPPRLLFGHIPADLVGPGLPATDVVAPPEGFPLDPLVFR